MQMHESPPAPIQKLTFPSGECDSCTKQDIGKMFPVNKHTVIVEMISYSLCI